MAGKSADSGVEDVGQGVFSQKKTGDDSHAFGILIFGPNSSQISDGVDGFLFFFEVFEKKVKIDIQTLRDFLDFGFIFFDERNDCLSIVLRYVFCFVLYLFCGW